MPYWFTQLVGMLLLDQRSRVHVGNDTSSWRPNVTAFQRLCPCTGSVQLVLQRPASYTWPKIHLRSGHVSPFKADTSANWNAVSHRIWRGCRTSVDSGDLNQAPPKQSAVCYTCTIPAPLVNYQFIWMTSALSLSSTQPIVG